MDHDEVKFGFQMQMIIGVTDTFTVDAVDVEYANADITSHYATNSTDTCTCIT